MDKPAGSLLDSIRQRGRPILAAEPFPIVWRKFGLFAAAAAALTLSGCVVSQTSLVNGKPTLGQQFEIHLYEEFVDGKASAYHTSTYAWKGDKYVRMGGMAKEVTSIVAEPLDGNDSIIEGAGESPNAFNYWIGRKVVDGVYLIFPLNEADASASVRDAACAKDQPEGMCLVKTHDQLVTLARATAARPVRNPSLGVIVTKEAR